MKSECAPYLELAAAYGKSDEAVNKVLASHGQTFQEVRAPSMCCSSKDIVANPLPRQCRNSHLHS